MTRDAVQPVQNGILQRLHERAQVPNDLSLRPCLPGDEAAFRTLNEAWLTQYGLIEDRDRLVVENPLKNILAPGGQIFIALVDEHPVGCCALLPIGPRELE